MLQLFAIGLKVFEIRIEIIVYKSMLRRLFKQTVVLGSLNLMIILSLV